MSTETLEKEKTDTKLNQLEQLKKFTIVVADTGDFESIKEFKPQDATTNPSLIYAATQKEKYFHLLDEVIAERKNSGLTGAAQIEDIIEHLLVKFGGRDAQDRSGPRFDGNRRALFVRHRRFDRQGAPVDQALQGARYRSRTCADQDRFDMGGNQCGRAAAKRRDQLQSDVDVFAAASGALCGSEGAIDLAVRRPDLRLV